jgi:hypothetical protein
MDPQDTPELEHAPYSPSSLKYFALCPSWKSGDSEEIGELTAARGTAMHKAFEAGDLAFCETDEEKELVQKALNYVDSVRRRRLSQLEGAQRASRPDSGPVGLSG